MQKRWEAGTMGSRGQAGRFDEDSMMGVQSGLGWFCDWHKWQRLKLRMRRRWGKPQIEEVLRIYYRCCQMYTDRKCFLCMIRCFGNQSSKRVFFSRMLIYLWNGSHLGQQVLYFNHRLSCDCSSSWLFWLDFSLIHFNLLYIEDSTNLSRLFPLLHEFGAISGWTVQSCCILIAKSKASVH